MWWHQEAGHWEVMRVRRGHEDGAPAVGLVSGQKETGALCLPWEERQEEAGTLVSGRR